MAANLNKISDRVKDISKTNQLLQGKQKDTNLKSKGLLAHRPTGRPPFLAWVEHERAKDGNYPLDAEYSAVDEERRLESIQYEKQQKLKKFQLDVRQRVRALERLKQLQQLDKSYEAVTAEQKIIYQSSFPKRIPTSKKDTCVYREANYSSFQVGIPGSCKYGYSVVNDPEEVNIASELLDKQVKKVQTCTRHARKVLGSQMVDIDLDQLTQLPGGVWKGALAVTQGEASDQNVEQSGKENPNLPITSGDEFKELTDDVKDMSIQDHEATACTTSPTNTRIPRTLTGALVHGHNKICRKENSERVDFSGIPANNKQSEPVNILRNKVTEDLIRPGKVKEQSKKQVQKQLAVYRQLFMDIEREQVRENLRMKEHRKRMTKLKNKQEMKRKEVEYEIDEIIEERNLVAEQKTLLEQQLIKENLQDDVIKEEIKLQKDKELERYVDALRATLKEKITKRKLQVPSLCSCGPTIFDTNPETCANNCIFYKNPKGYVKALSSVLSTTDFDL